MDYEEYYADALNERMAWLKLDTDFMHDFKVRRMSASADWRERYARIGLYITRFAADVTRPVSSLSPLEKLAKDECVEPGEVVRLAVMNMLVLPVVLSLFAAFLLPRKQEDD